MPLLLDPDSGSKVARHPMAESYLPADNQDVTHGKNTTVWNKNTVTSMVYKNYYLY